MDQKLEVNVDLFQALTSVLGAAPTEAAPTVILSAYLHFLAKDYGLSDSQSLSGDHLNRVRPPLAIAPWLTDLLGGEPEPEFLRDRVYRAFVELAQDSDARRLINRRQPLSEIGVLKLAQVHWNVERTETRPLLPVRSAQAIAGKLTQVADIKANAHEDFATMRLTPRSNIGVTGLGDGQAFQSSGQGFRTLGARIAVLCPRRWPRQHLGCAECLRLSGTRSLLLAVLVVVLDVLDVAGHRVHHPEKAPDRLNVLVGRVLAVVEVAVCESVSHRRAGAPRVVVSTGLRRVVCDVEDRSVDCQLQSVRGLISGA